MIPDVAMDCIFWIRPQKHRKLKEKNRQMGLHQSQKLLHSRGNNHQSEKTAREQEKTLAKCPSDKSYIRNSNHHPMAKNK
jgi:hypothetical protein